jgi:hypothetical protein
LETKNGGGEMTDAEWIESVKQIKDPVKMLECIVEYERFFGFDPHYSELRAVMLNSATRIISQDYELEMVTITRKEYESLKNDRLKLSCLESGGVDNWGGYEDAMDDYEKYQGEVE